MRKRMIAYPILFILFLLGFSLYGFWSATHPHKFITRATPETLAWEFEDVVLRTEDGVKLAAWFVPSKNPSDKAVILLHGYPADKANILYWAEFLQEDFNLLFVDFRYFGQSEGAYTTIGLLEQKDVRAALDELERRGIEKIGVMGFSLGGATALLAAARDARIQAVASDSAFAHINLMGYEFYRNLSVLKYPLTWLTKFWAGIFLRIDANAIAPENAAAQLRIPVLVIHSKKDQTIPFENALRIEAALRGNPRAEFLFLAEGTHGNLPSASLAEYQKSIRRFFRTHL